MINKIDQFFTFLIEEPVKFLFQPVWFTDTASAPLAALLFVALTVFFWVKAGVTSGE